MKDPQRFLESEGGELERELLESATHDVGSARAYRRVRAAVGAGVALTAGAEAGAATSLATGKAAIGAMPALVAKWLAVGAATGAAIAGTTTVALSPAQPPVAVERAEAPRAGPPPPVRADTTPRARFSESARNPTTSPETGGFEARGTRVPTSPVRSPPLSPRISKPVLESSGTITPAPRAPNAATFAPASAAAPKPSAAPVRARGLAEEVALVDAARAALTRSDATTALALTVRHGAEYPKGALILDVAVLRIRALLMTGRRAEAEREARRVVAVHPTGPYAARIQEIFAASNP
jgi:hypothetical protein